MKEPIYLEDKLKAYTEKVSCTFILGNLLPCLEVMYAICEDHFQPSIKEGLSKKQVLAILENTFESWNKFAKELEKTNVLLSQALLKYSYKFAWTRETKNVAIYAMLKTEE